MKRRIVPFFISHRGCPHRCVFCDQQRVAGADGSLPGSGEIREKVAEYRRSSGRVSIEVAYYGGSFTSLPREEQLGLLIPLQPLIASGEVSSIRVSTRPDSVNGECASLLRAMGVRTVEIGVQSMDDGVLALAGRGHTAADVEAAVASLKGEGMAVGLQLMPGLPGDCADTSLSSLSRALTFAPDFLRIYPTVVLANTALADRYAEGSYLPLTLRQAVSLCKVMLHRALLAGVPVIRMGLQPTAELERPGAVIAGPYHPAFRQMVEAELRYDLLEHLVADRYRDDPDVEVFCSPARVSDVTGQRRVNLERLLRERGVRVTGVRGDARLSSLDMKVAGSRGLRSGNILSDLHYTQKDITYA
jgi:histone acetyltransferase (RNA polymerase elongator complex component)